MGLMRGGGEGAPKRVEGKELLLFLRIIAQYPINIPNQSSTVQIIIIITARIAGSGVKHFPLKQTRLKTMPGWTKVFLIR